MGLWDIISWVVVGALAGWVASLVMNTDERQGGLANVFVGVVGALVGGYLMHLMDKAGATANAFHVRNFLVALGGAIVVLFLYKLMSKRA
jgi:uncharacterized membrane protein YeaQ/YmgE (transglycosylase-associated protein family)